MRLMRLMRVFLPTAVLLCGGLLAAAVPAPHTAPVRGRIDVSGLGPQVGERVPDFALEDQHGKRWTLHSIMRPKGAMLVFFRSADW
jgi:cytochrome oxidase Cu insertion factor (SCO1/SenC/PrrC family)